MAIDKPAAQTRFLCRMNREPTARRVARLAARTAPVSLAVLIVNRRRPIADLSSRVIGGDRRSPIRAELALAGRSIFLQFSGMK